MPTLIPTAATGARSKPEDMTYVDPARTMRHATSGPTSSMGLKGEEMVARIKGLFD
jgi:hypothetical protein